MMYCRSLGFIPAWASRVQKVCRMVWGVMFGRASSGLWCLLYFLTSPWNMLSYFGFEEPQAIYKWQKGKSLPTVDNLYALAALLQVTVDDILVPLIFHILPREQQAEPRCSPPFFWGFAA